MPESPLVLVWHRGFTQILCKECENGFHLEFRGFIDLNVKETTPQNSGTPLAIT